uniref:Uncharacterized protein n=1 Tax=Anguilla anguilla TaxID=7936 RepID=A0A0E9RP61_ANGAN
MTSSSLQSTKKLHQDDTLPQGGQQDVI